MFTPPQSSAHVVSRVCARAPHPNCRPLCASRRSVICLRSATDLSRHLLLLRRRCARLPVLLLYQEATATPNSSQAWFAASFHLTATASACRFATKPTPSTLLPSPPRESARQETCPDCRAPGPWATHHHGESSVCRAIRLGRGPVRGRSRCRTRGRARVASPVQLGSATNAPRSHRALGRRRDAGQLPLGVEPPLGVH